MTPLGWLGRKTSTQIKKTVDLFRYFLHFVYRICTSFMCWSFVLFVFLFCLIDLIFFVSFVIINSFILGFILLLFLFLSTSICCLVVCNNFRLSFIYYVLSVFTCLFFFFFFFFCFVFFFCVFFLVPWRLFCMRYLLFFILCILFFIHRFQFTVCFPFIVFCL